MHDWNRPHVSFGVNDLYQFRRTANIAPATGTSMIAVAALLFPIKRLISSKSPFAYALLRRGIIALISGWRISVETGKNTAPIENIANNAAGNMLATTH
jgi:hypothetical protein